MQLKRNDKKTNKFFELLLIHHAIIQNLMKYDKNLKPETYNKNMKDTIKELLKIERKHINDLF